MTKADINKRGYNKFLCVSSGVTVSIDESKIEEDKVWDGLKGYRTNTNLPADQVYQNYQQLWNVERAFYDKHIIMQSSVARMHANGLAL